ncbi:hypothetical protein [Variovorax sp. WS11]|uniref:hypothetical protein n=1 Tax=Variovorax sp. WS11 TaxID=1105204 RepID=UPI001EF18809|nr:hypothetical protein [Variovorax sp. WS11]
MVQTALAANSFCGHVFIFQGKRGPRGQRGARGPGADHDEIVGVVHQLPKSFTRTILPN